MVGVAPPPEHRVRCQPPLTLSGGDERLIFEIDGHKKGVSLKINKLSRRLVEALPDRALDLIEIAALVYAVDASISRGESTDQQMGAKWHRLFVIEMPVFDLDIWTTPKIKDALEETLMFLSGDSLQNHTLRAPLAGIRIRPRRAEDGLTVPLQLQMLPAEMLPLDMNRTLPGAGLIRQGIEFDGIGRRVAYHFLRRHPGDLTDPGLSGETVRVLAADVIHVLDPVEAGQLRGVSRFAAAIVKLFTLDLYDDAELERKKIAAMFAMFITSPAPETPLEPTEEDLEVEPGQVVRLDPGEDVSTPATPDSGGTYEPFQYAPCCRSPPRWACPMAI